MKIDLHCHTIKTKKSDGINRNVTVEDFSKYMKDLEIRIVAITNHNYFDLKQYNEFSESVKETTMVWPGIELDIKQKTKDGIIEKLVNRAKEDLNKELAPISEFKWKMNCYTIWHSFYELNSKYTKNEDIDFTYNMFLNDIIKSHFLNNEISLLPVHKIERILTDEEYRKKYNVKKLPDDIFVDKLLKCFNEKIIIKNLLMLKIYMIIIWIKILILILIIFHLEVTFNEKIELF